MYDLNFFRTNLQHIRDRLALRGYSLDIGAFDELDSSRRRLLSEVERLRAERNQASAAIAKLKKAGEDTTQQQQHVRELGEQIARLEEEAAALETKFRDFLARVPNLPHESVPAGKDERDNVEIRRWGEPRQFSFTPKAHWDLGPALGILDLERAAKVTGARFDQFHARSAHRRAWLSGSAASVFDQVRQPLWHGPASEVRRGSLSLRRARSVARAHSRSPRHQPLSRGNTRCCCTAHQPVRIYALFPQ